MGGLGGHIYHLYENPSLSFGQMKSIFHLAIKGELEETYEKLDGQNIVFSYDLETGTVAFARNKGDIKTGGMGLKDVQAKWQKLPKVQGAYVGAYNTLQHSISKMSDQEASHVFGPNKNIWYSAEVITAVNPNVINYGRDAVSLHQSGYVFDKNGNQIENTDVSKNFAALENLISSTGDSETKTWDIWKPIIISLKKSKDVAERYTASLSAIMSKYGMSDGDTMKDFMSAAFIKHALSDYDLSEQEKSFMGAMFAEEGHKREKKKKILANFENQEQAKSLYTLIQQDTKIKKIILKPLEELVHGFAVEVLSNTRSLFVSDHEEEVKRLRDTLTQELETLKSSGGEEKLEKLKASLEKLRGMDNITSSMEGIIFTHNGHTYKLTGNFAPINQILGMIRYG